MKRILFLSIFLTLSASLYAQHSREIGVSAGGAGYFGELSRIYSLQIRPAASVFYRHDITSHITLRPAFSYAFLTGSDVKTYTHSKEDIHNRIRNLHFYTNVFELSLAGELYLVNRQEKKFAPYLLAGLGVFHFNPKADIDDFSKGIWLQQLGTEGQGIEGYGKKYSLIAFNAIVGMGFNRRISDKWRWGFEGGFRFTSTGYLDDVSGTYADKDLLARHYGHLSVFMSDRSAYHDFEKDLPLLEFILHQQGGFDVYGDGNWVGVNGYGRPGDKRGNGRKDRYMLLTFSLSYTL